MTRLALTALRGSRRFGGPVAAVAVGIALVLLLQGNGFTSTLILDMLVYAIAAMSLDFLGGYAGLISLGQAGFLGVGAYGVAIAEVHFFSPWAAVGIGLGAALALGLALGIVAVRVRGVSFVIITLAMGQVLWGLAFQWVGLSEGDNGIPLTILPSIGPFDLNDPLTLRMTVLAVFAVVALLLVAFVHSPFGLSLRGVRSNETRMAALGYRTGLHCYLAWVIAVFFTGVAGVLYIFVNQLISPATMAFSQDGLLVIMVVLGGLRSIWGPALGAVVIVLFQQELSIYLERWQTVMGLTLIAVVLFSPGGLWGLVRAAGRRRDALIARLEAPPGEAGRPMTAGPAPARGPPALEADHLCRRFRGVTAVADVSLRVAAGARFGIIGPNGAGKTTLFNLLSGELRPTTGSVALFGRDITALRTYRRAALGLGRTFQITRIFSDLTVLENLTLALHGLSRSKLSLLRPWRSYRAMTAEAADLAASFGLAQRLAAPASDLSHGEVRELEVLLALALKPRVLLLDEPAAGLSPAERVDIQALLTSLPAELTLVMIEHDIDVLRGVVDSAAVLHLGSLVVQGIDAGHTER